MRIVTRKTIDILRQNKTKREKLKQYQYSNLEGTNNDEKNTEIIKLQEAIKSLPNNQQIVLRLFYTQEYSLFEIGNILDISIGTVKSRLFHAREKLKTILKT
jgi:RNA polymerase sigma-70 factor (ECF subfamily)